MELSGVELLDYACQIFEEGKYDEALDAFVLAYSQGIQQHWILDMLYNCYVEANEPEFQNTFEHQCDRTDISYNDCALDFIPYREGEYYIFDKKAASFQGLFSIHELMATSQAESLIDIEFSAAVLEMNWNWCEEYIILSEAIRRNVFLVCHDLQRCVSFYKIPELAEYIKNIKLFKDRQEMQYYFHENTSIYLPKIICGSDEDKKELTRIMDEEHLYRLTPEGRNTENVLLSIAIPTHARGHQMLKRMENLCRMSYDAEVEFAISKNCISLYEEEYEKVSKIPDARMNYYNNVSGSKPLVNWHFSVEMSHGKYVLLVSDEDDVELEALEHYLKLLSESKDVSLIRARTAVQNYHLTEKKYAKKGLDAFDEMFLKQNYLSGIIVQREKFLNLNLLELEQFCENPFYVTYPHEWWCAMLSKIGDYIVEPVKLINENESVLEEEEKTYKKAGMLEEGKSWFDASGLPLYATYENRLRQFEGQIDFVRWFMQDNQEGMELGLNRAFAKTAFLLGYARDFKYKLGEYSDFVDQFLWKCMEAIDDAPLEHAQRIRLLQWVKDLGDYLLKLED